MESRYLIVYFPSCLLVIKRRIIFLSEQAHALYLPIQVFLQELVACVTSLDHGSGLIISLRDLWLTPEDFKIDETNSNPPSLLEGYHSYHHFTLNVKSPSLSATIKVESENHCYGHWDTPNVSVPIGG